MGKRIYLVVSGYFPRTDNLSCLFVYDQVLALMRQSDFHVVVVNPYSKEDYKFKDVYVLGSNALVRGSAWYPHIAAYINARRLKRTLSLHGLDISDIAVVHCHLAPTAALGIALKRLNPSILTIVQFHEADVYGLMTISSGGLIGRIKLVNYFCFLRWIFGCVDVFAPVSENVGKVIQTLPTGWKRQ